MLPSNQSSKSHFRPDVQEPRLLTRGLEERPQSCEHSAAPFTRGGPSGRVQGLCAPSPETVKHTRFHVYYVITGKLMSVSNKALQDYHCHNTASVTDSPG